MLLEDRRTLHFAEIGLRNSAESSRLKKFVNNSRNKDKLLINEIWSKYRVVDRPMINIISKIWNNVRDFIKRLQSKLKQDKWLSILLWIKRLA